MPARTGSRGKRSPDQTDVPEEGIYSHDEITALQSIFNLYDTGKTGEVSVQELEGILQKIGHNPDDVDRVLQGARMEREDGQISFQELLALLEQGGGSMPIEGPDPKVTEFLRILEEYRLKCEEEGNYLEAGRAHRQLDLLRKQEVKRQQKAVRARQLSERQDVQVAHNMQFSDFNAAWDKYLEEYDRMAQVYIQQMTERHAVALMDHQQKLQREVQDKPPKWSKELLEWRRRQHILARQRNYAEAQKVKKIADQMEEAERLAVHDQHGLFIARKDAAFRAQQQSELQALLKRIDARRKEHIKQRNLDSKRLLQRNRNVQSVLESKQAVETQKLVVDIKKSVLHPGMTGPAPGTLAPEVKPPDHSPKLRKGSKQRDHPGKPPAPHVKGGLEELADELRDLTFAPSVDYGEAEFGSRDPEALGF